MITHLSLVFVAGFVSTLKVNVFRDNEDFIMKNKMINNCTSIASVDRSNNSCKCPAFNPNHPRPFSLTFMSREKEHFTCTSPGAVGCLVHLGGSPLYNFTFVLKHQKRVNIGKLPITEPCYKLDEISDIQLWNIENSLGIWVPLNVSVKNYFHLMKKTHLPPHKYRIFVKDIDVSVWGGHVVKMIFTCGNGSRGCGVMKIAGKVSYPFDLQEFVSKLDEHSTPKPLLTTRATAQTKRTPVGKKTTAIKRTTLVPTKEASTLTTIETITSSGIVPTVMLPSTSGHTIIVPKGKGKIVSIVVPIVICIVLLVGLGFGVRYARRRDPNVLGYCKLSTKEV